MLLQITVSDGLVEGVMAPTTPKGARLCLGNDVLGAGGLVRNQNMLGKLMLHLAHFGFRNAQRRHRGSLGATVGADGGNQLFPIRHAGGADGLVARLSGGDGFLHGIEHADKLASVILGRIPCVSCGRRLVPDFPDDLGYQLGDLRFSQIDCHSGSSFL